MKIFQRIVFLIIYFNLVLPLKCLVTLAFTMVLGIGFIMGELCPGIYRWSRGLTFDVYTNVFTDITAIWEMEIDYFKKWLA